jgi:hypothetical protein
MFTLVVELYEDWMYCMKESFCGVDVVGSVIGT